MTTGEALETDVVVLGAGVAGLVAARRVVEAGSEAIVLEARDRVGGRTLNGELAGAVCELGGQWVGPTQDRVLALIAELGLETFPTYTSGENVIEWRGRLRRYRGTIPRGLGPATLVDLERVRRRLARDAACTVDPTAPGAGRRARELDGLSVAGWLHRVRARQATRDLLTVAANTVWGLPLEELGLLGAITVIRSAGSLDMLLDAEGGAQQDRIVGGSQRIALALALQLGERVHLSSAVTAVDWNDDGVLATQADGQVTRARRAIITAPPPLTARIIFTPALPAARARVAERMSGGSLWKVAAAYPEPFWRADGLSGEALSYRCLVTVTPTTTAPLRASRASSSASSAVATATGTPRSRPTPAAPRCSTASCGCLGAPAPPTRWKWSSTTGPAQPGAWADPCSCPHPEHSPLTAPPCATRSAPCTGREPTSHRSGAGISTAPYAPARPRPQRC